MTIVSALESLGADNPNDHYYVTYLIEHQDILSVHRTR